MDEQSHTDIVIYALGDLDAVGDLYAVRDGDGDGNSHSHADHDGGDL
jgi:hypothetical protein